MAESGSFAFVAATSHDRATSFIYPAARKAIEFLRRQGLEVLDFTGDHATTMRMWTEFWERKSRGERRRIGVIYAHGDKGQQGLIDEERQLLFSVQEAKVLAGSILLLCSCLKAGDFPRRIIQPDVGVRAVIGYHGRLFVPLPKLLGGWPLRVLGYERFRDRFADVVNTPLVALLAQQCSVDEACWRTQGAWASLAADSKEVRLGQLMITNRNNLGYWPESA